MQNKFLLMNNYEYHNQCFNNQFLLLYFINDRIINYEFTLIYQQKFLMLEIQYFKFEDIPQELMPKYFKILL